MKLTWYGHSCFLLQSDAGSVVFDPYEPGYVTGLTLPSLEADLVLCSHGHRDHNYREGVRLTGRQAAISVSRIETWHDEQQGALRGANTIHVVEAEGLRLAHLGDLGHELSREQLAALGKIDVLLLPVGGHYTIGPAAARRVADAVGADVTIPMHYRGAGFGFKVLSPVEEFLALSPSVRRFDGHELTLPLEGTPVTAVLRCP